MAANPAAVRNQAPAKTARARPVPPRKTKPPPTLWRRLYDRYGTAAGMTLAFLAITVGYLGRDSRRLFAEQGLGYALGIVGSLLILTLLLYPLRKRIRLLKVLGPVKNWFRVHMPMTFALDEWRDKAETEPYDVPMRASRSFGSRATASQIRRIANATTLSAYVTNPEHRSPRYELVRGEPRDWLEF